MSTAVSNRRRSDPIRSDQFAPGAAETLRFTLPASVSSIIGREDDIKEIAAQIGEIRCRIVTLTGPGGVGKTRLALAVAAAYERDMKTDVAFVPLAPIQDADSILTAVIAALGIDGIVGRTVIESISNALRRPCLLVLDNVEHLLPNVGDVAELLARCPQLKIVATSRAPLRLSGEFQVPVRPLVVPPEESALATEELARLSSVQLFVERAQAVNPAFKLGPANAWEVGSVCRRLDGLPLAIELAAARSRFLSPAAVLARLDDRLALLSGGPIDVPERLRTMRDAIGWSYDLLDDRARSVFAACSVFTGGFTLPAAESVIRSSDSVAGCDERDGRTLLEIVERLTEHGLLIEQTNKVGEPRLSMLETIREFGLEQLAAAGHDRRVFDAHAAWALAFARETGPRLIGASEQQTAWWYRIEAEIDNVRAAARWSIQTDRRVDALRMVSALDWFWTEYTYLAEGRRWFEDLLANTDAPDPLRARALAQLGGLLRWSGEEEAARVQFSRALDLNRALDDRWGIAGAMYHLAAIDLEQGKLDCVLATAESGAAARKGDAAGFDAAWFDAATLQLMALAWAVTGEPRRAFGAYEESGERFRQLGDQNREIGALCGEGFVALLTNELARAARVYDVAMTAEIERHIDQTNLTHVLCGFAVVAAGSGKPELAVRLFAAASAHQDRTGYLMYQPMTAMFDRKRTELRAQVGEAVFAREWRVGRGLTIEAAAQEARTIDLKQPPVADEPRLSARETEVLRLLADGRSDQEIAAALFISRKTASNHVARIIEKLDVANRTAAVGYAIRQGIV